MISDLLRIAGALALVALNAFFVATEFAITRIRPSQVSELVRQRRPGANAVRDAVEHLDAYLAACQLGITVASIGLGALAEPAFERLFHPLQDALGSLTSALSTGVSFALAFALVTLLHVVLGELSPKSLAIARTERTALIVTPPMRVFYKATKWIVDIFNGLGNLVLKPLGVPPAREVGHAPHTESELRMLLEESARGGLIDPYEREFAENVFLFGDLRARQVMVPRGEVDYLVTDDSLEETVSRAAASMHTRLPLCLPEEGLDGAIGIVNTKELLGRALQGNPVDPTEIMRPVMRVSGTMLVAEVLRDLRRRRQHLALVVDEFGTVIGLVTLEDIIEEIVGEFEEETDEPDEEEIVRQDDGTFVVSGSCPVGMLEDALDIEISNGGEATIGGHVIEMLGRLPRVGEAVMLDGAAARVLETAEASIVKLEVIPDGVHSERATQIAESVARTKLHGGNDQPLPPAGAA